MPEFNIEISMTKVVSIKASNIDLAKEKVLKRFNDGLYDMWTFDLNAKLYEDFNPVITQEELDTCDGGINE